ncbi:MAG: 1-acyl-sn-glycerol-3-phosphate acyltransferase [Candidatus Thiodiazotropha sp. (ex Epidulcina cf. delphinae)]|nr:1-acyl-sn-glycerol-3-phosphate acyltransferase [Candidatus Thiodiazotropha sp. (ex Epidulcina cf. delphinae)]
MMLSLFTVVLIMVGLVWLNGRCREAARIDWGWFWLNRLDGFNRLYCHRYHRLAQIELPIPETGAAIVVANHISGLDPLLMVASSRRPLRFLIAREQYQRFGVQWLFRAVGCIPVDRENSPEKAMRQAFKALREGEVVALFPHGKIHLDTDSPRKIKAGAARLAVIAKVPLIPLRISGVLGQGKVMSPVFLRGQAKIRRLPMIRVEEQTSDELNVAIQQALDP